MIILAIIILIFIAGLFFCDWQEKKSVKRKPSPYTKTMINSFMASTPQLHDSYFERGFLRGYDIENTQVDIEIIRGESKSGQATWQQDGIREIMGIPAEVLDKEFQPEYSLSRESLEIGFNELERFRESTSERNEQLYEEFMRYNFITESTEPASTPWSDPDADPIADIEREVERQNMNKGLRPNPTSRQVAVYNTAQNTIHGHPQECDGYCAPDECVCPFDEED